MKKTIAICLGILLASCMRDDVTNAPNVPPFIPANILDKDSAFAGYGDTVLQAGKSAELFMFDHYTLVPYPGNAAHVGENDLLDFWDNVETPIAQKLYKDLFSTMQGNWSFMHYYGIGMRSHFKQLPDTSFVIYWYLNELQR